MKASLAVLLTNITLGGRTGTEIQTRNFALELARLGHRPLVYSPIAGPIADEIHAAGIPVVTDISQLTAEVDVIHAHHVPTTVMALAHFPQRPALFMCHDYVAWHDEPPRLPSIRRYVAVDETVKERLVLGAGIPEPEVRVVLNGPDLARFVPGPVLPAKPRRALAMAKNRGHIAAIVEACAACAIDLDLVGMAVGHVSNATEELFPQYDLVFASGLTAFEALATGRAVVVCDGRGLAGMCDLDRFALWRRRNLGLRILSRPLTTGAVGAEIDRYDPPTAAAVSAALRAEGGLSRQVADLVGLYREVMEEHQRSPHDPVDLLRALAVHLQGYYPGPSGTGNWFHEREQLHSTIDRLTWGTEPAPLGALLSFRVASSIDWWQAVRGFADRESWGTWTEGERAVLRFRVVRPLALRAELNLLPYLPDYGRELMVAVVANGTWLAEWSFRGPDTAGPRKRTLVIPEHLVARDGSIWLTFTIKGPRSPCELGQSEDDRRLGIGLLDLTLTSA